MSGRQISTQTRTIQSENADGTVTTKVIETVTTTENGKSTSVETITETTGDALEEDFKNAVKLSDTKAEKKSKSLFSKHKGKSDGASTSNAKPVSAAEFEKNCLAAHNEYRKKHGVSPLKLSKALSEYAKEWVTKLAKADKFEHRSEHKYGENIFMKWTSDPNYQLMGSEAVDSWYSEIKDHTFGQEPRSLASGHFTQVIWKESKEMGVATAKSTSGKLIVVANYDPPGNFVGTFAANVPPLK